MRPESSVNVHVRRQRAYDVLEDHCGPEYVLLQRLWGPGGGLPVSRNKSSRGPVCVESWHCAPSFLPVLGSVQILSAWMSRDHATVTLCSKGWCDSKLRYWSVSAFFWNTVVDRELSLRWTICVTKNSSVPWPLNRLTVQYILANVFLNMPQW